MILFLIPYSGAGKTCYWPIERELKPFLSPITLETPGHGGRIQEQPLSHIHEMVEDLFTGLKKILLSFPAKTPYAFFGHSLGALLAYLLTRKIRDSNESHFPCHLFLSSTKAPSIPAHAPFKSELPDKAFYHYLKSLGGMSEEFLENQDLMNFFIPILRADIKARETYVHPQSLNPLSLPVTLYCGTVEDFTEEEFLAWKREFTGEFSQNAQVLRFPGKHFYFQSSANRELLIKNILSYLVFP